MKTPLRAYLFGIGVGLLLGVNIARAVQHYLPDYVSAPIQTMTKPESVGQTIPMVPTDIVLSFIDDDDFDAQRSSSNIAAFAQTLKKPCRIVVPVRAGYMIADAEMGRAAWQDYYTNEIVAHEVLHCLRGDWHGDWADIMKRREKVVKFLFVSEPKRASPPPSNAHSAPADDTVPGTGR